MTEFATIQLATYTEAEWTAWGGVLLKGQMAFSSDALFSGTDQMKYKVGNGTDVWTDLDYVPEPSGFTGGSLTSAMNEAKGADIASATTTNIGAATGNFVHVTGTTTITGLGTVQAGTRRIVRFAGILTLTHNATSLILPTGANITTAANDVATFVSEGSGNWRCVDYLRADGSSLVPVTYGTTAGTSCEGNDSRLSDTRITRAIFKQNTTLSHTGDTNNTLKHSTLIAGGTFEANDILKWSALIGATSNANAKTFRFYFNTSASLSGATLVATYAVSSGAVLLATSRLMIFKNSVSSQEIHAVAGAVQSEYSASGSTPAALTINFAVDQYFIVAIQLGNSGDTANIYGLTSEINR